MTTAAPAAAPRRPALPSPNPDIAGLAVYLPGRSAGPGAVKLASNENPFGASPAARLAIRRFCALNRYPDGGATNLRAALARALRISADCLLAGAGSDEIADLIARAYLVAGDAVLYPKFTFIRYAMVAQSAGARRIESPVQPDFSVDVDRLISLIRAERPKVVFLANPNNPTGAGVSRPDLRRILRRTPARTLFVLDEAYFEYAMLSPGHPDGARFLGEFSNLVVLRTFSKIYGLAALRVGYAVAHPSIIANLNKVRPPFNVSAPAQAAAVAALADGGHVRRCARVNLRERALLSRGLEKMGFTVTPSLGNFLMVGRRSPPLDGRHCFQALQRRGVIIRDLIPYGIPDHVRVTVGRPAENARMLAAFRKMA